MPEKKGQQNPEMVDRDALCPRNVLINTSKSIECRRAKVGNTIIDRTSLNRTYFDRTSIDRRT